MANKTKSYQVQARLSAWVSIEIQAASLEEAFTKAKASKQDDFVEYYGELIDTEFRISGVYEN